MSRQAGKHRASISDNTGRTGLERRKFLTFLVAAPTLTVAARLIDTPSAAAQLANVSVPEADLAAALQPAVDVAGALMRLTVTENNRIVFEGPRAEVGQGITTAIAMMVAEDLDARLADVDVPLSDARAELGAAQITGGSTSTRNMWGPVRQLAAVARARLVTAAAQRWGLDARTLTTRDTAVHAPDGRSATYGSLTRAAAAVTIPAIPVAVKSADRHQIIGRPTGRIDAREIVTGTARYAMDIEVPGALPTVVARPPTFNGTVASFDGSVARAMPGVVAVVAIPTGVAVSATSFHEALKARDALRITWGPGSVDTLTDSKVTERLRQAVLPFASPPLLTNFIDASFDFAFVNHAPMEVNCAIADVRADRAEIWCASKAPNIVKTVVSTATLVPETAITVHVTRGGGSFGRRIYGDAAQEAAQVSKAIGKPVKLMWTRADDMKHGRMRPASHHRMRVTHAAGVILTFENRSSAVQLDLDLTPFRAVIDPGFGGLPTAGAAFFVASQAMPYSFGVTTKTLNEVQLDVPTAAWRSVYSGHNRAAEEIMVDVVAKKLGKDPVQFRIDTIADGAGKSVMRELRTRGGWGRAMPAGWAQGVAFHREYNAQIGCLVELDATDRANPRVTKAVVVADMGRVINPSGAEAQLMGGVNDGISTILRAGVHITDGAVLESSFGDFQYARQKHSPLTFQAHFLNTARESGGAGELAVPAAAGAVANAYARATGVVPKRFPINH